MTIPRVTEHEIKIMKLLATRKTGFYGLELVRHRVATKGGIYVQMQRLEDKGLVMSTKHEQGNYGIRMYELTDAGRGWLKARAILERYFEDRGIR